jgi:hypothetical protein
MPKVNGPCTFQVYGLCLRSDHLIPGPRATRGDVTPTDLNVSFVGPEPYRAPPASEFLRYSGLAKDERGQSYFRMWKRDSVDGACHQLRFTSRGGYVEFIVNQVGDRLQATWTDEIPFEDVVPFLLGPALGYVLSLRGVTCLQSPSSGPRELENPPSPSPWLTKVIRCSPMTLRH